MKECLKCNGEDYIEETCIGCNGSAEGMGDGSTCIYCKGSGVNYYSCPNCKEEKVWRIGNGIT